MIYVSIGGKHKHLTDNTAVHGCSAYGAGCIAIQGNTIESPSKLELEVCGNQFISFGFNDFIFLS